MAKSGGPSIGSPAFYFKQLYNRAEGWTVARVAVLLGYRPEKSRRDTGQYSCWYRHNQYKGFGKASILPPTLIRSRRFELHYSRAQAIV